MVVRDLRIDDYASVQAIYRQGIASGDASFETEAKEWPQWDKSTARAGRLVALNKERIVGWACLSDVNNRCVYRGVAETSIYVEQAFHGRGIGVQLLHALVHASEQAGYWTLQARIFPENIASIRIHEKAGFKAMGLHTRLGKLEGVWRDVQLLERRSAIVGLD